MSDAKPLVLDVDGTFLRTDMLLECFWAGLGRDPIATLSAGFRLAGDRAALKRRLVEIAPIRTDLLPVNPDVAAMAQSALEEGREVVLASASDESLVSQLAEDYGLSDRSFASDGQTNLKGSAKAGALVEAYGAHGFDYAGNGPEDKSVWAQADHAVVVGDPKGALAELEASGHPVTKVAGGWAWKDLIRAMRPHQWVKNVLLLLPMIAAHDFALATLLPVLWGIAAFSAAASCIYIVNDLLDLEADRLHETKCNRPFASGAVPILTGMAAMVALAVFALGSAAILNWAFFGVIALYMILSLAYSLRLKRMRWVDVATLAALYTLRVVAGAAAGTILVSALMLTFIFPVFVTLGCVKRLTELARTETDERLPGRGYGRLDRGDLLNVAGLGVFGALLIFFLYSFSEQGQLLYPTTWILWVALIPLAFWLIRMVLIGWRGQMHYDPIVFALRDKIGVGIICFTLSLMFYAAGLWAQWFGI